MKKRNNYPYHHAAALLLPVVLMVLMGACTADDGFVPWPGEAPVTSAPPLTITVTDGAYAPASAANDEDDAAPATRAVERGYATEFTAGDKIGLYEVTEREKGDGTSIYRVTDKNLNLCLTYDGTAWTLPKGAELTPERPADGSRTHYYAYYPWQQDEYMDGKVVGKILENPIGTPWTLREFFAPLISTWRPASNQSTYAAYTASDLMVSLGTVTNGTDGSYSSELRFEMEHQMALAVVRVPSTEYTYSETVSGRKTEKSYRLYTGMSVPNYYWQENSHTARSLVSPDEGDFVSLGTYYTAGFEKRSFTITASKPYGGIYRLYTIDGGAATTTERPLKAGDFYMSDGSVLPGEAAANGSLPADMQADCLGVVFWVGEIEGVHWTQTGNKQGDHLLMRDHPECTRGMAVALRDASPTGAAWATGEGAGENLLNWANGFGGFTPAEQADREAIEASGSYGYCSSRLMKLYGAHHPATTFPAYGGIDAYADAHPAPAGSSGWFLPSMYEFATLCFGAPINFNATTSPYYYKQLKMLKEINPRIDKAAGDELIGNYWSSYDWDTKVWHVYLATPGYGLDLKSKTHKVRAVIAF
ncbi:fimbrillin family protein [Phocaeicola dorei]|jgi:hypothetical protein|uniref:fimbrillin family protein n=1 Tax=Phocaeicola dorei TaxID=357276 RepID=UPI003D798FD9